jgi:hypothetical protein
MFTRCTECQTVQRIALAELRDGRGLHSCRQCHAHFDALPNLADNAAAASVDNRRTAMAAVWAESKTLPTRFWRLGSLFLLALLGGQTVFFESGRLLQNPQVRPVLAALCEPLQCRLPVYKNPDEMTMTGFFSPVQQQYYRFRAVITNNAAYAQHYPTVKLTLLNYEGRAFAARVFKPDDYLPATAKTTLLEAKTAAEIDLKIAVPKTPVGGSSYELL